MRSQARSKVTTDHAEIRRWAEARGGRPATVKSTAGDQEAGVLRIDFPGYSGQESMEEISWNEFFEKFDEKNLALVYQESTAVGTESRFSKLVNRDTVAIQRKAGGGRGRARGHAQAAGAKGNRSGGGARKNAGRRRSGGPSGRTGGKSRSR